MSELTTAEVTAKTAALKVLQKELGWVRTNAKPFTIGAVVGAAVVFAVVHFL